MPAKTKRAASNAGSIRRRTKLNNSGKQYTWWEARYTQGHDAVTGKQIQRTITGKTQKEVAQKLRELTHELDAGTYIEPSKMTVADWMDIWLRDYLGNVKDATSANYEYLTRVHINPTIGQARLESLQPHTIQALYNKMSDSGLSAKTVKNVHGVLHRALAQAQLCGYLRSNPSGACILPRVTRRDLTPLDEEDTARFLKAIRGHRNEPLFITALFTGMREGEILGLTWDCVDFENGLIYVNKQLQMARGSKVQGYKLVPPKNGRGRVIAAPALVMRTLRAHRTHQTEQRLRAGALWHDTNLVFTLDDGLHIAHSTIYKQFKAVVKSIGRPDARFHDLRHSYAVAAIRAGDDIKTVQGNLGHATASFTLDVYGHVTDQMRRASASRMDSYIDRVLNF
jgi:integrase